MTEKSKKTTLDLSGALLELDGDTYQLESGELVLHTEYLYAADDAPDDPTETLYSVEIEGESRNPEDADG